MNTESFVCYVCFMSKLSNQSKIHFSLFAILLLSSACATSKGTYYEVTVDALSARKTEQKSVTVLPGTAAIKADGLRYKNYARMVENALSERNFKVMRDGEDSDLVVGVYYEVERDKDQDTFKLPAYHYDAKTKTLAGEQGSKSRIVNFSSPKQYIALHDRFVRLIAITAINPADNDVVWETVIYSRGTNDELNKVFPVLMAAATPYLGTSTGGRKKVEIYDSDNRVKAITQ